MDYFLNQPKHQLFPDNLVLYNSKCLSLPMFVVEMTIIILKIITFDPSIYTVDQPDLTVPTFMEEFIGL